MRTAAWVLAVLAAASQLALFLYGQMQVDTGLLEQLGGAAPTWWSRAVWAVVWAVPWLVGATLLLSGHERTGVAVLVTVAVLSFADLPSTVRLVVAAADGVPQAPLGNAVAVAASWSVGAAAGVAAWRARPRGGWRDGAPGPGVWFTVAAIAAWLPLAFRSTAFAPPGAPRRFVELLVVGPVDAAAGPVVAGLVLLVASRRRRQVAGAIVLTFAVPRLLAHAASLRSGLSQEHVIATPAGVLGLAGTLLLVLIGVAWVATRRVSVSDAATDRGPDPVA